MQTEAVSETEEKENRNECAQIGQEGGLRCFLIDVLRDKAFYYIGHVAAIMHHYQLLELVVERFGNRCRQRFMGLFFYAFPARLFLIVFFHSCLENSGNRMNIRKRVPQIQACLMVRV